MDSFNFGNGYGHDRATQSTMITNDDTLDDNTLNLIPLLNYGGFSAQSPYQDFAGIENGQVLYNNTSSQVGLSYSLMAQAFLSFAPSELASNFNLRFLCTVSHEFLPRLLHEPDTPI